MTDKQYESFRVRYNDLIDAVGYDFLMIGEPGTEAKDWGLPQAMNEIRYQLHRYLDADGMRGSMRYSSFADERNEWKRIVGKLKRFLNHYEKEEKGLLHEAVNRYNVLIQSDVEADRKFADVLEGCFHNLNMSNDIVHKYRIVIEENSDKQKVASLIWND